MLGSKQASRDVQAWRSKKSQTWFRIDSSSYRVDFDLMVQAGKWKKQESEVESA